MFVRLEEDQEPKLLISMDFRMELDKLFFIFWLFASISKSCKKFTVNIIKNTCCLLKHCYLDLLEFSIWDQNPWILLDIISADRIRYWPFHTQLLTGKLFSFGAEHISPFYLLRIRDNCDPNTQGLLHSPSKREYPLPDEIYHYPLQNESWAGYPLWRCRHSGQVSVNQTRPNLGNTVYHRKIHGFLRCHRSGYAIVERMIWETSFLLKSHFYKHPECGGKDPIVSRYSVTHLKQKQSVIIEKARDICESIPLFLKSLSFADWLSKIRTNTWRIHEII